MARVNKIVLDDMAGKQVVPYLPLDQMIRPRAPQPAEPPPPGGGQAGAR
jgi:hypothetical protein